MSLAEFTGATLPAGPLSSLLGSRMANAVEAISQGASSKRSYKSKLTKIHSYFMRVDDNKETLISASCLLPEPESFRKSVHAALMSGWQSQVFYLLYLYLGTFI